MGKFSDCFERFPEENPANYDEQGRFNPNHRTDAERMRILNEKLDLAWVRRPFEPEKTPPPKSES